MAIAASLQGGGDWIAFGTQSPLAGKVVGIDPGHNGLNYTAPQIIDQPIWNGREDEPCDTTGTATDGGYTEAQYNFDVATYLQADLEAEGARVVMTRPNNSGVGPCATTRAAIINDTHANVAVDIHADGGPVDGRGFAVLEPVADGPNNAVIASSASFAAIIRDDFLADTGMPVSTYDGVNGLQPRDNLAGLNLTTVPKVLIECGNMRNSSDRGNPGDARIPGGCGRGHGAGNHRVPDGPAGDVGTVLRGTVAAVLVTSVWCSSSPPRGRRPHLHRSAQWSSP